METTSKVALTPTPEHETRSDPGKTLGIVGFLLSLLGFNVISFIIGAIAYKKSRAVNIKNWFAVAAMVISVLSLIAGLLYVFIVGIPGVTPGNECDQLGPGTHVKNGKVIDCSVSSTPDGSLEESAKQNSDDPYYMRATP